VSTDTSSPTACAGGVREPLLLRLLGRWFRWVNQPREAPQDLAELSQRGSLVFVMRSAGLLNFLYLSWLLRRLCLPRLRAALGLTGVLPRLARVDASPAALEQAVAGGEASVVFLGRSTGPDPFPLLAQLQRGLGRPIYLVPALLVWTRRPQKLKPRVGEILFGTPDAPSRLANAIGFLLNHRRAVLRMGRASDLAAFLKDRPDDADAVLGRKIRGALHHHLARQTRAVVGPPLKTAARTRAMVLRDKGLRAVVERMARESGRPRGELWREAERDLREIASRYAPAFIELVRPALAWWFHHRYDAVEVDEEGLARVKRLAADAPIVLCPSHKSHVDYLVLSWLFSEQGMTSPHVAAGVNLAFWPFGPIARWGGAFFIRRTVKGDRVYTATLRAYVKQLLRERFPQEFYLEGGRSRTGKLLFPKTGLFAMEVDAWLEEAAADVLFVPVAIDYERLMEARSYARELAGGEKRKEDLRGLMRGLRRGLGGRHGRLHVQFEEPISLRAFAAGRVGGSPAALTLDEVMPPPDAPAGGGAVAPAGATRPQPSPGAEVKRALVQALANRVAYGINRAVTVTPVGLVAAALLARVRRAIAGEDLARRIELLRRAAIEQGARFSSGLPDSTSDPRLPGLIAGAVANLAEDGLVRVEQAAGETFYQAVEERRPVLDYYKNAVLHRYVGLSLVAAALRGAGGDASTEDVRAGARWLSRLFKLEFMYRVGATFEEIFDENAQFLCRAGAMEEEAGRLRVGPERDALEFLAELTRPYAEAYLVAAEALLVAACEGPGAALERRALARVALERGRAAYATGRIALRESLSNATLTNAIEWFIQQGALEPEGGRLRLAASWAERSLPELTGRLKLTLAD
jgi:glycerol-3-phosphate O-acyltransferase